MDIQYFSIECHAFSRVLIGAGRRGGSKKVPIYSVAFQRVHICEDRVAQTYYKSSSRGQEPTLNLINWARKGGHSPTTQWVSKVWLLNGLVRVGDMKLYVFVVVTPFVTPLDCFSTTSPLRFSKPLVIHSNLYTLLQNFNAAVYHSYRMHQCRRIVLSNLMYPKRWSLGGYY